MNRIDVEKKNVLSIEAEQLEMDFLLRHCMIGEDEQTYVELSEESFGKPFEKGASIRATLYYWPSNSNSPTSKNYDPLKDRLLLSHIGKIQYNSEYLEPIVFGSSEVMNLFGKYGNRAPEGNFRLVLEEVVDRHGLGLLRVEE